MPRRRFPRVRRVAKWGGLGVCACVLAGWLVSAKYGLAYEWHRGGDGWAIFRAASGRFVIAQFSSPSPLRYSAWKFEAADSFAWLPQWVEGNGLVIVAIPFWIPLVLVASPVAWLFRSDKRRAEVGECPWCLYNRAGLPDSASCPECGAGKEVAA